MKYVKPEKSRLTAAGGSILMHRMTGTAPRPASYYRASP
jgi:hypothetical protein